MANRKYTADEFEAKMNEFFAYCTDNGKPPINFNLTNFFGLSADVFQNYRNYTAPSNSELEERAKDDKELEKLKSERDEKKRYTEAVKKLDEFRTNFWLEIALADPKLQTFAIFNLKQPFNGGYSDRQQIDAGGVNIVVNPGGVGGNDAFK